MIQEIITDVLVVGSGAAGLCAAIAARQENVDTLVASLSSPGAGNATAVSGGWICAAVGPGDSPEIHFEDMLRTGEFLNDRPLAAKVAELMPACLPRLEDYGVRFLKADGRYKLTSFPGHSRARTLVVTPKSGIAFTRPLVDTARGLGAKMLPNFNLVKVLVQDGRAIGAIGYVWDTGRVLLVSANAVVLATGGASLLYDRTQIPLGVPGDGYGIALDAGLALQDMEFVQFVPTVLAEPGMGRVIIGHEYFLKVGATFKNALGEDIVAKYGLPGPESITAEQLSTAMAREVVEGRGVDGTILMDATRCRSEIIAEGTGTFIKMVRERQSKGDDLLARPVRVAPANQYFTGGIRTNADGETSIEGLLACGEVAGGAHGAKRPQGAALSETVVIGFETGRAAARAASRLPAPSITAESISESAARLREALGQETGIPLREIWKALQSAMTAQAGLFRDARGLQEAKAAVHELRRELPRAYATTPKERAQLCTASSVLDAAECVVVSALARRESRGAHLRLDYPQRDDAEWLKHITCAKKGEEIATSTCPVTTEPLTR